MKKTDWVYGSVSQTILEYAKRKGKPFCVTELYPIFEPMLAALNCRHLYESGRLRCIRKGATGRCAPRGIYQFPQARAVSVRGADNDAVRERVNLNLSKLRVAIA